MTLTKSQSDCTAKFDTSGCSNLSIKGLNLKSLSRLHLIDLKQASCYKRSEQLSLKPLMTSFMHQHLALNLFRRRLASTPNEANRAKFVRKFIENFINHAREGVFLLVGGTSNITIYWKVDCASGIANEHFFLSSKLLKQ